MWKCKSFIYSEIFIQSFDNTCLQYTKYFENFAKYNNKIKRKENYNKKKNKKSRKEKPENNVSVIFPLLYCFFPPSHPAWIHSF